MPNCWLCGKEINDSNVSVEHLILQSIGGKLKSKNLLCKNCNSKLGQTIDTELYKQLKPTLIMLNVKQERGTKKTSIRAVDCNTGEEYKLLPGGKPEMSKPNIVEKNDGTIYIEARSRNELKLELKKKKKKYPQIDISEAMQNIKSKKEYLDHKLKISHIIGGQDVFRSICKTAINFYLFNNGDIQYVRHLIPYVKGENELKVVNQLKLDQIEIDKRPFNKLIHEIILKGDPEKNVCYAYIKLFNVYKYLVLLSDNYNGDPINCNYAYDLIRQTQLENAILLNLSKNDLYAILSDVLLPKDYEDMFRPLHQFIVFKQRNDKLINDAWNNTIAKYSKDIPITYDMFEEFWNDFKNRIVPFL